MRPFSRVRRPDRLEHEADAMAARALTPVVAPSRLAPGATSGRVRRTGPALQDNATSDCDGRTRASGAEALATAAPSPTCSITSAPGRPLEPAARTDLDRRFHHDFSQVRVHVDDDLSQTARSLGSRAVAIGTHVGFAPGEYHPFSQSGRALLAHELAHVVQAAGGGPAGLRSKKDAAATLFYEKELRRTNASWGHELLALRPFIALCDAVDQERVTELPARLDALEKANIAHYPPHHPSSTTATALHTRLLLLGQPAPARRFRAWYFKLTAFGQNRSRVRRYFDDEIWLWENTLPELLGRADAGAGKRNLGVVDAMRTFFTQVLAERDALEPGAVKQDAARLKNEGGLTDTRFGMETSPLVSIARYHARLDQLAVNTFAAAQQPYQFALDAAIDDLTAGKGATHLAEVEKRLASALSPMAAAIGRSVLEINETVYTRAGNRDVLRQVDRFLQGPAALRRSVKLTSYDETTSTTFPRPSQQLPPQRIVALRTNQIAAVKRIYGLEVEPGTKQPTPDARENQAALAALGSKGLRLHSDDDWRQFAKAKFEQHLSTTKRADKALDAVVDLLKVYLKAFTVHSPMNIDDFGDNLLTLTFPRALTGQLVHDCGVYALRIAYILSLIRDHPSLKLRFRYIQLPVHVGLIVTGSALPAYLIHNDTFTRYDSAELQSWRKRWNEIDAKGEQRTRPAPASDKNDEQFLAELAGMEFVPNTDLPFIVTDVPKLGGTSGSTDRATLWKSYQSIVRNELFGPPTRDPKDPAYQFHLRYLDVLEDMKKHHNTFVVPFWNAVAHPAWVAARPLLEKAARAIGAARDPGTKKKAESAFDVESRKYLLEKRADAPSVHAAFSAVQAAFSPITKKTGQIMLELHTQPKIVAPRAGRTSGDRLLATFEELAQPFWARETLEHFALMRARTLTPPPPYGDRKKLLDFVD